MEQFHPRNALSFGKRLRGSEYMMSLIFFPVWIGKKLSRPRLMRFGRLAAILTMRDWKRLGKSRKMKKAGTTGSQWLGRFQLSWIMKTGFARRGRYSLTKDKTPAEIY